MNAAPGLRMHLSPSKGKSRNVADLIIDMLFPPGTRHSVPIISITGTNGKTTTTRMIAHIFKVFGMNVGKAVTGGIHKRKMFCGRGYNRPYKCKNYTYG